MIRHTPGKRKVKKAKEPILTVEGVDSPLVADNIIKISYKGSPSLKVRGAMRQIIKSNE